MMSDSESITARTGVHKAMANFASPQCINFGSQEEILAQESIHPTEKGFLMTMNLLTMNSVRRYKKALY